MMLTGCDENTPSSLGLLQNTRTPALIFHTAGQDPLVGHKINFVDLEQNFLNSEVQGWAYSSLAKNKNF